jgi:hypothetical protein
VILRRAKKFFKLISSKPSTSYNVPGVLYKYFGYKAYQENQSDEKIRVDVIVQDGKSLPKSSAFIRLIAPLTHPVVANKISLNICQDMSDLRNKVQIVIVQRAVFKSFEEAQSLIRLIKNRNVKLVIDTDDAFFNLDKSHPNYEELHDRHDALLHLIKNADELWVSTNNLKKYYQKICKTPVQIISNTLDSRVWRKNIKNVSDALPLQFLYMGTATHGEDFQMIAPWLDKIYKKYPNSFELHIVGVSDSLPEKPWLKLIKRKPNTVIYPNFARWIQSEGPFDIGLAPLIDSEFNKYKSDIKCLDYLAIGVLPMVSKVAPYSNQDLDKFIFRISNKEEDWLQSLEKIISNPAKFRRDRLKVLEKGQNYIWQKRSSEITAKKIANLLEIK